MACAIHLPRLHAHNAKWSSPVPVDSCDVRDPEPVRRVVTEVSVDEVGGWLYPFVAEGGARSSSTADASEAFLLHQPLDALATHTNAGFLQLGVDARGAAGLAGCPVNRSDAGSEIRIGPGVLAGHSSLPGVEASLGHAEDPAHRLDREHGLVRSHESEDRERVAPLSCANQAAAFERISLFCRN